MRSHLELGLSLSDVGWKFPKYERKFVALGQRDEYSAWRVLIGWNALAPVLSSAIKGKWDEFLPIWNDVDIYVPLRWVIHARNRPFFNFYYYLNNIYSLHLFQKHIVLI